MTLKHRNIKTAIESADLYFTFVIFYSNCSLLTKKPHEIRETAGKKCRMHYFCEKGAEMLDQEPPSYPDDGLWKGGLNTS